MRQLLGLALILLTLVLEVSSSHKCTPEQGCCVETSKHAAVCRSAETHCARWQNETQTYGWPLPDSVRRMSPWNATCSLEEYFCPLTFQCINKTDPCTFNTAYVGDCSGNSTTPWGQPCPANYTYCPLFGACIPPGYACSLQQLENYLQNNTQTYFGIACPEGEVFCPGTQGCISNATACDFNSSLAALNITCPANETYCIDERKCMSGPCGTPNRPSFAFSDNSTGWQQFCNNFQYICPKILSIESSCKPISTANPMCDPKCGRSPFESCQCSHGFYKCNRKSACFNETSPCAEPPSSSICPSPEAASSTMFLDPSPSANASSSDFLSSSVFASVAPPVCNYTCSPGFTYCSSLSACVMNGYNHCGKVQPYCPKNHLYCASQGKCVKDQEGCPSVSPSQTLPPFSTEISQTTFVIYSTYAPSMSYFQNESSFSIPPSPTSSEAVSVVTSVALSTSELLPSLIGSSVPPSSIPPLSIQPSSIPPSSESPLSIPSSSVPPSSVPPSSQSPLSTPPSSVLPSSIPPLSIQPSSIPPSSIPPSSVPPLSTPPSSIPPSSIPPLSIPPSSVPPSSIPPSSVPPLSTQPSSAQISSIPPSSELPSPSLASSLVASVAPSQIISSSSISPPLVSSSSVSSSSVSSSSVSSSSVSSSSVSSSSVSSSSVSSSSVSSSSVSSSSIPSLVTSAVLSSSQVASSSSTLAASVTSSLSLSQSTSSSLTTSSASSAALPSSQPAATSITSSLQPSQIPSQSVLESLSTAATEASSAASIIVSTPPLQITPSSKVEPTVQPSSTSIRISPVASTSAVPSSVPVLPTRVPPRACHILCQLTRSKPQTRPLADMEPPLNASHKIAIVALPGMDHGFTWSAFYNSMWHTVVNVSTSNALVLGHLDKIRADPNTSFVGEIPVAVVKVSSAIPSGSRINATGYEVCLLVILYIPGFPKTFVKTRLIALEYSQQNGINVQMAQIARIGYPKLNVTFKFIGHLVNSSMCVGNYSRRIHAINRCVPKVKVDMNNIQQDRKVDSTISSIGQLGINMSIRTEYKCDNVSTYTSDWTNVLITLRKTVKGVIPMPHIPYGKNLIEEGTLISSLTDFKSGKLGMAIVYAPDTKAIGYYEYLDGGYWKKITIPGPPSITSGSSIRALFLNPNTRIRFKSYDNTKTWSQVDASKNAMFLATGWDMSDQTENGERFIKIGSSAIGFCSDPPSPTSCLSFVLFQMRISGCDKRPGSTMTNNSCGECSRVENEIYKKCNSCLADIDDCGDCRNGKSDPDYNQRLDCAGKCGEHYNDSCGNCISIKNPRNFTDCNGVCNGNATKNKCGYCVVDPNTVPAEFKIDKCGVCGGNGSSCADCKGVPGGQHIKDLCENCKLESNKTFNHGCKVLGLCNVTVFPNDVDRSFNCTGAGIANYNTVVCQLKTSGLQHIITSPKFTKINDKVKGVLLSVKAGLTANTYDVSCTFSGGQEQTFTGTSARKIIVYTKSAITVTAGSPVEHEVGSRFDLTITGTNFFDSIYLKCITHNGAHLNATYVSPTEVKCHIPKILAPVLLKISLSWSPFDRAFNPNKEVVVRVFSYAASVSECRFGNNLGYVIVYLTKDSRAVKSAAPCSNYFQGVGKLGTGAICRFTGTKIIIINLGESATLKPDDVLTFLVSSIQDYHGDVTKYALLTQNVTVLGPAVLRKPVARLSAPPVVGICSVIKLNGRGSYGGGGRPLTYSWQLQVGPGVNSSHSDLEDYRTILMSATSRAVTLPAKPALVNIAITFTLTVTNFLGLSANDSKMVIRVHNIVPTLSVDGSLHRRHRVSRRLSVKAMARFDSGCSLSGFISYNWLSDNVTISLANTSRLTLPENFLKPDLTYHFSVSATLATNFASKALVTIKVTTYASALIPVLDVPSVVGLEDSVAFDCSASRDPDKVAGMPDCRMEFKDGSNSVYKLENNYYIPVIFKGCKRHEIQIKQFLKAKKTYTVVLTFKIGKRVSTTSRTVTVTTKYRPLVYFYNSKEMKNVPTSQAVYIKAKINVKNVGGNICYKWSCQGCPDFNLEKALMKGSVTTRFVERKSNNKKNTIMGTLNLAANKLTPGATFNFNLTACSQDCNSGDCGSAVQVITTNTPPSSCVLSVSPSSGVALQTLFTFEVTGCNDNEEDLPLKYSFGCNDGNGNPIELDVLGEQSVLTDKKLPPGTLTIHVTVEDQHGEKVKLTKTVVVSNRVVTTAEVSTEVDKFATTASTDIFGATFNMVITLETNKPATKEETEKKQQATEATLTVIEQNVVQCITKVQKMSIVKSVTVIFVSTPSVTSAMIRKASDIFVSFVAAITNSRKRRSASPTVVTPYTTSEAETYLKPFAALDPSQTDAETLTAKSNLLLLIPTLLKGLCRSSLFNSAALVAKTAAAVLQSTKVSFSLEGQNEIQLGCSDCSNLINNASFLLLGQTLQDRYSEYVCNPSAENCTGACIASAQMPQDFLSYPLVAKRLSSVVLIQLWNPDETYASEQFVVTNLASPMVVRIPLNVTTSATYVCKLWDPVSKSWVEDGAKVVSQTLVTVNITKYISCAINRTGYVTIFEGPALPTTAPPSTASTTTQSTVGKPRIKCQFSFAVTCANYYNSSTKALFEKSVKSECAKKMNVPEWALDNFSARCGSIIIAFDVVVVAPGATLASVNASVHLLKTLVENGTLSIRIYDGRTITASRSGFIITYPTTTGPPTTPTKKVIPKKEDKGLSGGAIAGIVIAVLVVVALAAGLVYYFNIRKHTKQDPTVDPNQNAVELSMKQGSTNPGYQESV